MKKDNLRFNIKYIVPAVEQASQILFCLANGNSSHMSLIDICTSVGIHKSKAYSILNTLQKFNLIQRNIDRKGYSLGPSLITLSRKVLDNFDISRIAEPALMALARHTSGTVTLGLIVEDKVYIIAKFEGEPDVDITARIGHTYPLSYGSHGKAIAAFLSETELGQMLERDDLYFHGKPENLDRERLQEELRECRVKGFALDLGEVRSGLNTAAAPVLGPSGTPIGYIALLGLFSPEAAESYGPLVAEAGKKISQQLGLGTD